MRTDLRRRLFALAMLTGSWFMACSAHAAFIVLDFEGIGDGASIDEFYNGGTDSLGNFGTDFGVSFSGTQGAVDFDAGGGGNFANEPSPDTAAVFFGGGRGTVNVIAGFEDGFLFAYSSSPTARFAPQVYVNRGVTSPTVVSSGALVTQRRLPPTSFACSGDPTGRFCDFEIFGVSFSGVARSIEFTSDSRQFIIDNLILGVPVTDSGNVVPPPVPEPGGAATLGLGLLLVTLELFRRKRQSSCG